MEGLQIYNDAPVATRPNTNHAMVAVEQERAMAEVQGAIVLAKKFPRNQIEAMDKILVACQRPGLAEQALYSYSRGGTEITGPSIRLAEAIAQNWQNLQFGIRELEQRNGESTVEAFCWDVENNTRHVKTFQVKHERHTKKGSYRLEDPRDIYELTANQGARRLRAAILAVIPGDVIESAVGQCEQTLKAKADTSPDALKKLCEAFEKFRVTKEQIEKRIQRRLDTITPAQLVNLRKIYNSLKDGMSSAADWFEQDGEAQGEAGPKQGGWADALKEKIREKRNADGLFFPADDPPAIPERTPADLIAAFDKTIPAKADPAMVEAYLAAVAAGNKTTVEAVKIEAAKSDKDLADLWKIFPGWCKQQAAKNKSAETAKNGNNVPAAMTELAPAECPDNPGSVYAKTFCDKCAKRQGCPAWDAQG